MFLIACWNIGFQPFILNKEWSLSDTWLLKNVKMFLVYEFSKGMFQKIGQKLEIFKKALPPPPPRK